MENKILTLLVATQPTPSPDEASQQLTTHIITGPLCLLLSLCKALRLMCGWSAGGRKSFCSSNCQLDRRHSVPETTCKKCPVPLIVFSGLRAFLDNAAPDFVISFCYHQYLFFMALCNNNVTHCIIAHHMMTLLCCSQFIAHLRSF